MKNYPELFFRDASEPKVEKFAYPDVFNEEMEFDLEDIRSSIDKRNVTNATVAYKKLNDQNVEIPFDLRLSLFQLVCFFNSKDAFEFVEELPFSRLITLRFHEKVNQWDLTGLAEKMWIDFFSKENDIEANSVYIQALIRYAAFDRAYMVFRDFQKADKPINLEAINSLIRAVPFITSIDFDVEILMKFLDLINTKSFVPTIDTINSLLFALSVCPNSSPNDIEKFAEQLLQDCKLLKLKQNLGTNTYVLEIFYKSDDSRGDIIYKIIDKLENETITLTCRDDRKFP